MRPQAGIASLRRDPFQTRNTDAFETGQQCGEVPSAVAPYDFRRRYRQCGHKMSVVITHAYEFDWQQQFLERKWIHVDRVGLSSRRP